MLFNELLFNTTIISFACSVSTYVVSDEFIVKLINFICMFYLLGIVIHSFCNEIIYLHTDIECIVNTSDNIFNNLLEKINSLN